MAGGRFNIVLICPPGYGHAMALWEVTLLLEASLGSLGIAAPVRQNQFDPDATNIVVGYHMIENPEGLGGIRYIPYQLEQFTPENNWASAKRMAMFSGAAEVWEYSQRNMAVLAGQGVQRLKYLPLGYHAKLELIKPVPEAEKTIDVLHYGSLNERRRLALVAMRQAGLRVEHAFGVYGAERDALIARSRVVVSIHYFEAKIAAQVRISYLLNNRCTVLAEVDDEQPFSGMIETARYEELTVACVRLVRNNKEREELAQRGYESFKERPMVENLRQVLV